MTDDEAIAAMLKTLSKPSKPDRAFEGRGGGLIRVYEQQPDGSVTHEDVTAEQILGEDE